MTVSLISSIWLWLSHYPDSPVHSFFDSPSGRASWGHDYSQMSIPCHTLYGSITRSPCTSIMSSPIYKDFAFGHIVFVSPYAAMVISYIQESLHLHWVTADEKASTLTQAFWYLCNLESTNQRRVKTELVCCYKQIMYETSRRWVCGDVVLLCAYLSMNTVFHMCQHNLHDILYDFGASYIDNLRNE